jgi:NAD(P)-dependent dehydrogenase (short-subunit alcohol dehydrogenase family)
MADTKSVLEGLTAQTLFDLRGVVAVVTGGASVGSLTPSVRSKLMMESSIKGIGLMISSTLMANGGKVYIVDIDQERLDRYESYLLRIERLES